MKTKKQDRLIGFFGDSFRRNYIGHKQVPTDYFPPAEFERIIQATYLYGDPRGGYIPIEDTRIRLRTLTLLMRWSGLRIGDAVTLERSRLQGDNLLLYQAKTGTPVFVPLPTFLVKALGNLPSGPRPNPRYFFWSGNGLPKSAVADWQRSYRCLFSLADIRKPDGQRKRCYPHMFRDTFAVELLLAGVPMDQVSLLACAVVFPFATATSICAANSRSAPVYASFLVPFNAPSIPVCLTLTGTKGAGHSTPKRVPGTVVPAAG